MLTQKTRLSIPRCAGVAWSLEVQPGGEPVAHARDSPWRLARRRRPWAAASARV